MRLMVVTVLKSSEFSEFYIFLRYSSPLLGLSLNSSCALLLNSLCHRYVIQTMLVTRRLNQISRKLLSSQPLKMCSVVGLKRSGTLGTPPLSAPKCTS